jgi:hypothetical protein
MQYGCPPSETEITEIVDRVLLPALSAGNSQPVTPTRPQQVTGASRGPVQLIRAVKVG